MESTAETKPGNPPSEATQSNGLSKTETTESTEKVSENQTPLPIKTENNDLNDPVTTPQRDQNGSGRFSRNSRSHRGGRNRQTSGGDKGDDTANGSSVKKSDDSKKSASRFRLFVGNLSNDTTEDDIRKMFGKFTETPLEVFFDKQKWFAFVKMDTRESADKAKKEIDGITFKNRVLRVRYAPQTYALAVKNLGQNVSNELLFRAFEKFGDLERAVVTVDEKGRPCGEGIVVFSRKDKAHQVLNRVNDGVFLLGASPRPVALQLLEQKDSEDGLPEVHVLYRQNYKNETVESPRFAKPGSLEHDFGMRWKKLFDDHTAQIDHLNNMFQEASGALEREMEKSVEDFELNKIKQTIAQEEQKMQQLVQRMNQRRGGGNSGGQRRRSPQSQQQNPFLHPQQQFEQADQSRLMLPIPPPGFGGTGFPGIGQGGAFPGSGPQPFPDGVPMMSGQVGFGPAGPMMGPQGMRQPFGLSGSFMPPSQNFGGQFEPHQRPRFDEGITSMGERSIGSSGGYNQKRGGSNFHNDGKRQRK